MFVIKNPRDLKLDNPLKVTHFLKKNRHSRPVFRELERVSCFQRSKYTASSDNSRRRGSLVSSKQSHCLFTQSQNAGNDAQLHRGQLLKVLLNDNTLHSPHSADLRGLVSSNTQPQSKQFYSTYKIINASTMNTKLGLQ